jgi:mitogen-activated protein kinase kinase kinase
MITADVENRRASRITFAESDDEEEELEDIHVPAAIEDPIAPTSEADDEEGDEDGEDEASEEEEEEDSSEDESTDEDEEVEIVVDEDADHGKAYMSTGCRFTAHTIWAGSWQVAKRIIKWIKGALIGAGSFGSVFLGMDSHSGLLMAVKQVELGKNRTSVRTKGMVDALEREIELLKELQHDNIVQYLGESFGILSMSGIDV